MKCDFIAICDDNEKLLHSLKGDIIALYPEYSGIVFSFSDYPSLQSFLENKNNANGIILIDIVLGNTNGIECAVSLSSISSVWKYIFITGYTNYLSDVFKATPSGLLYKPIDKDHLKSSIDKVLKQIENESSSLININLGKAGNVVLDPTKITYIESDKRIIEIHHNNKEVYKSYMKLDEICSMLPNYFIACHKSYVINSLTIDKYSGNDLTLNDGTIIPISRSHKQRVKELFFNNIFNN